MARTSLGSRALSVLLAISMVATMNAPVSAWADDDATDTVAAVEQPLDSAGGGESENADNGTAGDDVPQAAENQSDETETGTAEGTVTTSEELAKAIAAANDGGTVTVAEGTYTLDGSLTYAGKAITVKAANGAKVIFDMSKAVALHGAKITFEGVTFDYTTNANYIGLQHTDTVVYNSCTINGKMFLYANSETFNSCHFVQTAEDYNVWTYGAKKVAFNDCTFDCVGKAVNVYIEEGNASDDAKTIAVKDCTVNSTKENKAFLNIKNSTQAYDVTLIGTNTVNGLAADSTTGSDLYQVEATTVTETSGKPVTVKQKAADGTVKTVYEVKQASANVAKVDDTEYASLQEAISAAKSGDTVTLLGDVADCGSVTLSKNITLEGSGHTISGNSSIYVNMPGNADADVTIHNVTFKDIANGNKLSAFYFSQVKGKLTITDCTFDSVEYEAIQVTPAPGAVINVSNNVFKAKADGTQVRHIHIEMAYGSGFDYEGENINLTVTDNQLCGTVGGDASMGIWWVGTDSALKVDGNYIEHPETVSIMLSKGGVRDNRGDLIYPARSQADVDVDDLTPVAIVAEAASGDSKINAYNTLAEAVAAAKGGETVRLLSDAAEDVVINKSITLDLNGKTLTNTNAGKATVSVTGGTATMKNGNVVGGTSYYNIEVTKDANLTLTDVTATAGNTGSSMIDNWGILTINSGTYTGGLDTVKNEPSAKLTISGGTFTLEKGNSGFTAVVLNYGELNIGDGTFIQSDKTTSRRNSQVIHTDKSGSTAPSTTITGGTFTNLGGTTAWTVRETNAAAGATKVSGGTFNKSVKDYYCAEGYIPADNGDGTYGVKKGSYVASIGDNKYESLAEAVAAAKDDDTVTLLADVEQNSQLTIDKSITLDLNGKTIKNTEDIWSDGANAILSIEGGAKVTITGNGIMDAKENDCYTINVVDGDLTIENGTFYGNVSVVQVEKGSLSVKGGTFDLHQKWNGSSMYLLNCIDSAYADGSASVAISGGTFVDFDPNVAPEKGVDGKAPSFAAPGVGITKNADGSFTATADMTAQLLDKDGSSVAAYESLAKAIEAAKDGQTVRLLKDSSGNGIQIKTENFPTGLTVDFGGYTYTVGGVLVGSSGTGTNAFQLLAGGKVIFQNGSIVGVTEGTKPADDTPDWHGAPAMMIQNYCDLTLKNMIVTGGDETVYTVSNNHGDVVIEDSTINAGGAKGYSYGPFAFDVCGFSSYDGVSVTVKGDSSINGDIEISRSSNNTNEVKLALEGGTVTGKLTIDDSITIGDATTVTKADDVTLVAPDGCVWDNGTLAKAVAKVDGVQYGSLQAAIDAAKGGSTVRLLADIKLAETAVFPADKTVHINLQGHNITATGTALRVNGKTDIQSTGGNGIIESTGNVAVAVGDNAKVTVYSGTLKGREGAVITGESTGATIEIRSNPTLIATDNAVIAGNGSNRTGNPNTILVKGGTFEGSIESKGYIACGIYAPWNDNITVSGGTFNIENGAGIVARAGTVKVTGGTFNCGDGTAKGWVGDSKNNVPNVALVFDEAAQYPALTESSQVLVSGGSFSTDPAANGATLAEGYEATLTDGMYKVAKANPVAAIGDVKYDTLQAAITVAQATEGGATITLLTDIDTNSYYEVKGENPVTIDLNGHNITGSGISGLFYVTAQGNLTIKGEGTVTAFEDNSAAMVVWVRSPKAQVTLEGGAYKQKITNTDDDHFDLIYVEYGTVYVKDGTYEGATPDWTLNCKDGNYPNEANIEVTGGTFKDFDPANNTAEGEGTNFVPEGYVSTANANGSFTVAEQYLPVEYWTGFNASDKTDKAFATLDEAMAYAAAQSDASKRVVIAEEYMLTQNTSIPENVYVDVMGKLTIPAGVTLTVPANAKRLGAWAGGTIEGEGKVLIEGRGTDFGESKVMINGTMSTDMLEVPADYILGKNANSYYAAEALFEIAYADGTTKKADAGSLPTVINGATKVTLLKDVSDFANTISSSVADDFVLDLGGHTLSGKATASTQVLNISAPTTITNGTIRYASSNTGCGALITSADVVIDATATIDGGDGYAIWTDGYNHTLTVNGTVTTNGAYAITGNGAESGGLIADCDITVNEGATISAPSGIAIYHPELGTVTINGGEISGHTGIEMCAGKLVVNDGTITSSGANMDATGSQNAILDGAAISIINRSYPGGVPTAEISGGTFTATGEGALTVKAYDYTSDKVADWTDVADNVNISGGTFNSIPNNMAALCKAGYRAYENDNGTYTVKEGKFTVKVTSRTTTSDSPVANVSGGGSDITYAVGTKVTASAISGYKFAGWYLNEYTGEPYSTDLTCTVKPTDDCTMIAVYEPVSGGKFWLTVTASEFTVDGGAVQDSYLYEQYAIGASVTVEFTGAENFLYWVNASNKVVSTDKKYTFTMGSETTLKAVYGKARQNQATVVFISHSDQIISSKAYTTSDIIQFPVPPIKMGCTFTGWSMTEAEIHADMASNNGIIEVRALYTEPSIACKVTVVYPEGTDDEVVDAKVGQLVNVTAKSIDGKTFSCWKDKDGNILGYTKTLKLAPSGSMVVYAVYGEGTKAEPVISMTAIDASAGDGYYVISFTATRAVPEGYELVKQGILYSIDSRCAGETGKDYLKLTEDGAVPEGVYESIGSNSDLNGVTRVNSKVRTADTTLYGRGYMILKSDAGEILHVYTGILSGSYNSLNNGGN